MKIRVLYDNESLEGYRSGWGFSCLVDHEGRMILFDTGWDGSDLLYNMKKMGIRKESIDTIVISHCHWDHIGGLSQVLHPGASVHVPASLSRRLKNEISRRSDVHEINGPVDLMEGVHLTGELGSDVQEQSLILETGKGLFVITGCAHPGLDVILKAAGSLGTVTGVMGGFHGFDRLDLLDDLTLIVPCHCTKRKKEILDRFPVKTRKCAAGFEMRFD